ncbi:MAG: hypothetical protein CMJ28_06680 [Phycisphaerae bacterium]|nr:hypothetical protein [Phycisphaerae bacterium]
MIPVAKRRLKRAPGQMAIQCSTGRAIHGINTKLPSKYPPPPATDPRTARARGSPVWANQPAKNPIPPPTTPATIMAVTGSETAS